MPSSSSCGGRAVFVGLALAACAAAAATYVFLPVRATEEAAAQPVATTPTAAEFAHSFAGLTNAFAARSGDATRIANVDCVQASRGHYMCSYASTKPGRAPGCHVMQARWTPQADSTITVTLAGRAGRCGSLPEALESLD